MGYDLIPKKEGVASKNGMIFTWPVILQETGAGYLFGYGMNTFDPGRYIYDGSRPDGSPVSNDGFDVSKEDALIMARLFRGYVFVKRGLVEEWNKMPEKEKNTDSVAIREEGNTSSRRFSRKNRGFGGFLRAVGRIQYTLKFNKQRI